MDTQSTELTVAQSFMPVMSIQNVIERRNLMVEFTRRAMQANIDFGVIPGTGTKPTLLKPGAEKLCTLFGLSARPQLIRSVEDWMGAEHDGEPFFNYVYRYGLFRGETLIAEADGSCNSWEKKYRYRKAERVCPECDKSAIKRSKYPPRDNPKAPPGWYCYDKAGGCGSAFAFDDPRITEQDNGQVRNPDVADLVNTLQKMAQKRALVAATLLAVNASEFFTQDLDDQMIEGEYKVVSATTEAPSVGKEPVPSAEQKSALPEHVTSGPGIGRDEQGHATQPAAPASAVRVPQELAKLRQANHGRSFGINGTRERRIGPLAGKLDELAGDTVNRHTFIHAVFGIESMKMLADGDLMALESYVTYPTAKSEIARVIADYLKLQGQQELAM